MLALLLLTILPAAWVGAADAPTTPAHAAAAQKEKPVAVHAIMVTLDGVLKAIVFVDQYGDIVPVDVRYCTPYCFAEAKRLMGIEHAVAGIQLDSATMAKHPDQDDSTKTPI